MLIELRAVRMTRLSPQEWIDLRAKMPGQAILAPVKKPSKFHNQRVEADGIRFDSKAELRRWDVLNLLQRAGQITELQRQVVFVLAPAVRLRGRMKPALRYVADFTYLENGVRIVEDVKGMRNQVYGIKAHLMATVHGIEIRETKCPS